MTRAAAAGLAVTPTRLAPSMPTGCYASHIAAWQRVLELGVPTLVLEDDVQLKPEFHSIVEAALREAPDFGLLYFAHFLLPEVAAAGETAHSKHTVRLSQDFWGTYAYMISPATAARLLAGAYPMRQQVDSYIQATAALWGILVYRTVPHAVRTSAEAGRTSDTQQYTRPSMSSTAIPLKLHALCSKSFSSADKCRIKYSASGKVLGLLNEHTSKFVVQHSLQSRASGPGVYSPGRWHMTFHLLSDAMTLTQRHLQVPLDRINADILPHALCAALLLKQQGGLCVPDRTMFMRPLRPIMGSARAIVALDWAGELIPGFLAADTSSPMLVELLASITPDSTPASLTAFWQQRYSASSGSVLILPPHMLQPLPVLSAGDSIEQAAVGLDMSGASAMQFNPNNHAHARSPLALAQLGGTRHVLGSIPRVLHFIWTGSHMGEAQVRNVRSWLAEHQNWQARLWTVADLQHVGIAHPAYSRHEQGETARYELLWHQGGVFIDAHFECLKAMDDLLHLSSGFVSHSSEQHGTALSPSVFGFAPKHPLLHRVVSFLKRARPVMDADELGEGAQVFHTALGDELDKLAVLPAEAFHPVDIEDQHKLDQWGCYSASCNEHFPRSYAIYLWPRHPQGGGSSSALRQQQLYGPGSLTIDELKAEFVRHNQAAGAA